MRYFSPMKSEPLTVHFTPALREELEKLGKRYGSKRNAINAAMWMFSRASPVEQVAAVDAVIAGNQLDGRPTRPGAATEEDVPAVVKAIEDAAIEAVLPKPSGGAASRHKPPGTRRKTGNGQ